MVLPAASELEVVPIPRKRSGEGKRMVVDGPGLDEQERAYPLTQDVFQGAPANLSWERLDVLEYIGLAQRLDAERFSIL